MLVMTRRVPSRDRVHSRVSRARRARNSSPRSPSSCRAASPALAASRPRAHAARRVVRSAQCSELVRGRERVGVEGGAASARVERRARAVTTASAASDTVARCTSSSPWPASFVEPSTSACGIGIVGQPPHDPDPVIPTVASAYPPSGSSAACTTRGDGSRIEPRVAAADLASPLDEHDAELAVTVEARAASSRDNAARTRATATTRTETARFPTGTSGAVAGLGHGAQFQPRPQRPAVLSATPIGGGVGVAPSRLDPPRPTGRTPTRLAIMSPVRAQLGRRALPLLLDEMPGMARRSSHISTWCGTGLAWRARPVLEVGEHAGPTDRGRWCWIEEPPAGT